jgi:hypothetical protein
MKFDSEQNKKKQENIEKPETEYVLPEVNLKVYHSFEEMNADDYRHVAETNPVEGLRRTLQLILSAYGLKEEDLQNKIYNDSITVRYLS